MKAHYLVVDKNNSSLSSKQFPHDRQIVTIVLKWSKHMPREWTRFNTGKGWVAYYECHVMQMLSKVPAGMHVPCGNPTVLFYRPQICEVKFSTWVLNVISWRRSGRGRKEGKEGEKGGGEEEGGRKVKEKGKGRRKGDKEEREGGREGKFRQFLRGLSMVSKLTAS